MSAIIRLAKSRPIMFGAGYSLLKTTGCDLMVQKARAPAETKTDIAWLPALPKRLIGRGWPQPATARSHDQGRNEASGEPAGRGLATLPCLPRRLSRSERTLTGSAPPCQNNPGPALCQLAHRSVTSRRRQFQAPVSLSRWAAWAALARTSFTHGSTRYGSTHYGSTYYGAFPRQAHDGLRRVRPLLPGRRAVFHLRAALHPPLSERGRLRGQATAAAAAHAALLLQP